MSEHDGGSVGSCVAVGREVSIKHEDLLLIICRVDGSAILNVFDCHELTLSVGFVDEALFR